jgi:hypothetical protein
VIDNSAGAPNHGVVSEDVTATGFSPAVGPFTFDSGISVLPGLTRLPITDSVGDVLLLIFSTPTAGSLVGYTGGPLNPNTEVHIGGPPQGSDWALISGSLTPAAAVPEPSSLLLLLTVLACLGGLLGLSRRWGAHPIGMATPFSRL